MKSGGANHKHGRHGPPDRGSRGHFMGMAVVTHFIQGTGWWGYDGMRCVLVDLTTLQTMMIDGGRGGRAAFISYSGPQHDTTALSGCFIRAIENAIYSGFLKGLYSTIPHYTIILYYTILYYTILYHTIPYHTIPYCTVLYCTVLYCTVLYCTVLYHPIPYHTIQYYTMLCYAMLCYAMLC